MAQGDYNHVEIPADNVDRAVGFYKEAGGGGRLLQHFDRPKTINGRLVLGSPVGREQLDPLLRDIDVNSQLNDIVAFLGTLNGSFDRSVPSRVPSGLPPGGR